MAILSTKRVDTKWPSLLLQGKVHHKKQHVMPAVFFMIL